jgi:prepilin-type N-terminal cleavage/methylation domain-containing protein
MKRCVRCGGFTLTELLIVMVIIAVTLSVATLPVARYYRQEVVRGAADQFVSHHSLARHIALRYGRLSELHIDASGKRFWIEVDTTATLRDTIGVVKTINDVTITTGGVSLLCFDARGLPSTRTTRLGQVCQGPAATVTFALPAHTRTVTITALGKVLR